VTPSDWTEALSGMGARVDTRDTPPLGSPTHRMEADEQLRYRLLYIAGDTESSVARIGSARGISLEIIAAEFGLRRRKYAKIPLPPLIDDEGDEDAPF